MIDKTEREIYEAFEGCGLAPETVVNTVDTVKAIVDRETSISKVREFMTTFKQTVVDIPTMPPLETQSFRLSLDLEETKELAEAGGMYVVADFISRLENMAMDLRTNLEQGKYPEEGNIVEAFDALIDKRYIADGTILSYGLADAFEEGFEEVQESNMSKVCKDYEEANATQIKYANEGVPTEFEMQPSGKALIYRSSDKKVLKSINYKPANLKPIIDEFSNKGSSNRNS